MTLKMMGLWIAWIFDVLESSLPEKSNLTGMPTEDIEKYYINCEE